MNSAAAKPPLPGWAHLVPLSTGGISLAGYAAIAVFVGVFGVWSFTAPLSSGVVTSGFVAAAGQNLIIQHFEGGIVEEVHVDEGQSVSSGDVLLSLDSTRARVNMNKLAREMVSLKARRTRLEAMRDSHSSISFSPELIAEAEETGLRDVLDEQEKQFLARLARIQSEQIILEQRVASTEDSLLGLESQQKAIEEQRAVVEDEALRKKELLTQGLTNRSEYTLLLRSQAELVGELGSIEAQMSRARTAINEAEEQIIRQKTSGIEEALRELNDLNVRIGELEEQMSAESDVLRRTQIVTPLDGLIIRILYNTPGSVIRPGEPIIEVLPTSKELIIEAQLSPLDIDAVFIGQQARLRFVALNARITSDIPATVTFVSADRIIDRNKEQPYYIARLKIDEEAFSDVNREQVYPGMPVEVLITGTSRTFMEYVLQPLTDSFSRAFLEE